MTELLTAAQMRAIEKADIDSGEVTGLELMERAGRGVVEAIFEEWPELQKTSHRAVVLCGPGNNGGDGFVIARLLKEWGWEADVFLFGDPAKLPPDAKTNCERWLEDNLLEELDLRVAPDLGGADLVVDAIFGTGLTRPFEFAGLLDLSDATDDDLIGIDARDWLGNRSAVVAVDIPSGLCSNSGRILADEDAFLPAGARAHLTVTFHGQKIGHYAAEGPVKCGKTVVKSIGLANSRDAEIQTGSEVGTRVRLTQPSSSVGKVSDHKYTHGHAVILSGGPGKTGAARLAARGALRIGAGLVTVGCPNAALAEVAAHITAIMCRALDGAPGLTELLDDDRFNALCLGPGLGLGADTHHLVLAALKAQRATVLDADALTRFEGDPQVLFDALHENVVLTPHAGEFQRLFPDISAKLIAPATSGPAYSKVDATREAAARAGCTVLFKGPDTVIAAPDGRCAINSSAYDRAAPWLATAGSGDVLAGFITGLLARGFGPMQAAETAAWLHTEAALSFGPGLIAEDLPEELPKVFRNLGL